MKLFNQTLRPLFRATNSMVTVLSLVIGEYDFRTDTNNHNENENRRIERYNSSSPVRYINS